MPADLRYLKRRRKNGRALGTWTFQVAVPRALQDRLGTRVIERSLGTSSLREAQQRRWDALAEARERFKRADEHRPLSSTEIATLAQGELRETYQRNAGSALLADFSEDIGLLADELDSAGYFLDPEPGGSRSFPTRWRARAEELISRMGATPTEETIEDLRVALVEAQMAAYRAIRRGIEPPEVAGRRNRRPNPSAGSAPRISAAAEKYLTDREAEGRIASHTLRQYRLSIRLFGEFVCDAALDAVTRAEVSEFLRSLERLRPAYARSPDANGLAFEKLIEKFAAGPDDAGLAAATVNKHVTALSGLFKWAMRTGVLPEDHRNPFEGQHRRPAPPSKAGWLPYEIEELAKLVERPEPRPKRHTWASARPWIVLVALFSGMRLGEICSLDADDIKEEDRVPFFDITAAKSEAGIRRVPVHPTLLSLGFLDYVRHVKRGPLFVGVRSGGPDNNRSYIFSKRFATWRRRQGVDRPRIAFHSFRKNVVASLERARIHQSEVAQIVGHERGFTFSVYSPLGLDLQGLREVVEKITYPKLDIDSLRATSKQPRTATRGALARCPSTVNNARINDEISTP